MSDKKDCLSTCPHEEEFSQLLQKQAVSEEREKVNTKHSESMNRKLGWILIALISFLTAIFVPVAITSIKIGAGANALVTVVKDTEVMKKDITGLKVDMASVKTIIGIKK